LNYDEIGEEWIVTDLHKHTYYRYHPEGSLKAVTSRNGRSLTFHYENGSLCRMVTALGYVVTFEFHEGKLVRMQDDTGRSIGYRYEGGLLTEVIHMDGGVTRYAYSSEGYLIRPTDQTGLSYLTNEYDGTGRVTLQTLANGDTYRLSYHDREKKVGMEYSAYPGVKEYRYDERMTVREVVYPDGSSEYYEYDAHGNRILERDRMGWETRKEYDAIGHLLKEEAPQGLITEYHYDDKQDLVRVSDNSGYERLLTYDSSHNITSRIEKAYDNHYTERLYEYDDMGRLTKETDGEGYETTYRYEEDSAYPSVTVYGDGTNLTCTYSRNGRKLTEDDGAVRWEYAYNKGGYRTMERDGEGNETRYLYDGMGRKLALYTPIQWKEQSGKRTEYRYDFLERLIDTAYPDGSHERKYRDGEGNVLKEVHPNAYDNKTQDGEGTAYDYDGENRMLRIHYPDGGVERFFHDSNGNRIKHVLPEQYNEKTDDGAGWQYAYDEGNRLVSVTGPEGTIEETYAYDLRGNCIRRTDARGCSTYYTYDLLGRLVQELVPVGEEASAVTYRKTSYEYDDNGNRIKEIRHGGNYGAEGELLTEGEDLTLTFAYDARNRLVRVEDGQGARVSYRYDARGNRIGEEQVIRSGEDKEGNEGGRTVLKKIKYTYDKAGRLTEKKEILDSGLAEEAGTTAVTAVTTYTYDENGNRIHVVTPEGYHVSRSYDDMDRLTEEKLEDKANGIERTTRISYDRAGNVTSVRQIGKDGKARELTYDYDLKDRLTHAGELDGPVFMLSYDKNDRRTGQKQLLAMEEEKYGSLTFRYDMKGNLLERSRNGIAEEKNSYDNRGNRTETVDSDGVGATYRYGLQDEQIQAYTAASRKQGRPAQRLIYDTRGRITGVEDGCGNHTSYGLDAWGRIASVQTAEGGREQYVYDAAGNITATTYARGGVIRYAYNSQGQVCAITDQSGNTETFRYDREGRQVWHTDRKGTVTETRYNIYGQPILQTCTDSRGERHVMGTWEYDDFGQLKKSVAGGFCYTYEYRPDGKLLKKWNSGKQVISCDYYKNGELKSLTDVSGKTAFYEYDENGRLKCLKDSNGEVLTEYNYTNAGRLKEIRTSNGITTSYEYDGDGNISRLTIGNGTEEGLLYDAFMLYDLNGNRLGKTGQRMGVGGKQEMNTVFCYDAMNRLTMENRREGGEKYAYDLSGNRLSKQRYHYALTADGNMDSVIDGEENYCYNERNELTEKRSLSAVTAYLYDENGSLIKEKEGEKETGYRYDLLNRQTHVQLPDGREQENLYDGEGLRAGLTENGKSTTFLFYNGEILAECNGDSMPIRRHLSGAGLSHVQNLENNTFHAYHQDEQGSTAYVTGPNGGTENLYSYDGFGNLLESREDLTNRILYTGQQYDQETGQYYLRARYYNPVIGRFTQEDTYRGDGLNLYAYCANNPVMYYDPSGFAQKDCGETKPKEQESTKPEQEHHFASNKNQTYTPQFEEITNKYDLDLDDDWNKKMLPHQGRHPNEYHEYILDSMKQFDEIAQGDQDKFLKLFENLKDEISDNPDMLYKNYWNNLVGD
ncbi:MAG: AHH domain-containing protein, partial [Lachnospiraceae bacterium]|nr:AHH domain-containing protein [Lachnospiraceae bacterium]